MLKNPANGYALNFRALDWLAVARLVVDVVGVGVSFVELGATTTACVIAAVVETGDML